ncbi:hypothetical protein [Dyadobacter frigoris]|uniref:Lipoprotein n=1 Tax=Dyadobacter frigoris TaxID=2576211 RepID=A0A4U6D1G6_9BACT|nr:hypothetical protein [Dyadobacter frigoris]TKT87644.1 hypothetical protein FDK13_29095 [Dyadobacter frigoris]
MKKRTIKLAVLGLMMTAVLFNCKKDNTDPTTPDQGITDALKAVTMATVTPAAPVAVVSTPSSFATSAQANAVNGALGDIASTGVVPASVTAAATAVSGAVSASDVAALNSVSASTIASVSNGGAVPADIKAILDKARANPALAAYLPVFTFPSVGGVTLNGTRIAGTTTIDKIAGVDAVEKVEKVLVNDACVATATATFDGVKTTLDASKATQTATVLAAYNTALAAVPSSATCTSSVTEKYVATRATVNAQGTKALADIENAKAALGSSYDLVKALTNIALLDALSSINALELADKQACTSVSAAATANALAAKNANQALVDAAYATALASATKLKNDAIASCHNEGGSN